MAGQKPPGRGPVRYQGLRELSYVEIYYLHCLPTSEKVTFEE